MDTMLNGLDCACAYLDDIIIRSTSISEHIEHLKQVFTGINEYGFKVKENKCEFCLDEIKYLGQIISKDG